MTSEHTTTFVLRDEDGTLYLLTPELLAQVRVPAEQTAEITRLIDRDDVGGLLFAYGSPTVQPTTSAPGFLGTLIKVAPESQATDVAEDVRSPR